MRPKRYIFYGNALEGGFAGKPDHDHQILEAVGWRIYLVHRSQDDAKVSALIAWVQDSDCAWHLKAEFLEKYSSVVNAGK